MSVKITAIEGNRQWLDGGAMFGNAPRTVWEKWIPPDDLGRIPLACRAMLLEINGKKVLCETGIGAFFEPKLAERFGVEAHHRHILRENLQALGIREEQIDFVILSHLHFDHAGGLLPTYGEIQAGKKDLLFPKAQYVVGREAWERAINPHPRDKASFIPSLTEQLQDSKRLVIVEDEFHHDVLPDHISFFISNGHTPGQMLTICKGEKSKVVFAGDLIPGLPWVHLPITMGYDRFPEMLIDEKAKLYERVAAENWWVFFTHDPVCPMAHVVMNEKGRYEPYNRLAAVQKFELQ
ncbi:MAG: MBL fold metallo-hydrolase [Bdellovibrionales bacterium]